jgi:glutamine synthetase
MASDEAERAAAALLRATDADSLRFRWCDNGNLVRSKAVHLPSLLDAMGDADDGELLATLERSVWFSQAQMAIPVVADEVVAAAGLAPVHDVALRPDWSTLVAIPHSPGHLWVDVDMVDGDTPWGHCPRGFLRRMAAAATAAGLQVRVGAELEFHLFHADAEHGGALEPADDTCFALDRAFDLHHDLIGAVTASLLAQGIRVAQHHPESGPGQYELSLQPLAPLQLADAVVTARETIRSVALRRDLRATFLPQVFDDLASSAMHLHLSLDPDPSDGLGPHGDAFLAGLLGHLTPLLAATCPTPGSYRRFRPHAWVGAYAGWGRGNKEVPLRLVEAAGGGVRDVELKAVDGTANPAIALGCVLAAGLDGIARDARLPPELLVDPGDLDDAERAEAGIEPLPRHPSGPLDAFEASAVFGEAMGPLHHSYVAVKRAEHAHLEALGPQGEIAHLIDRL